MAVGGPVGNGLMDVTGNCCGILAHKDLTFLTFEIGGITNDSFSAEPYKWKGDLIHRRVTMSTAMNTEFLHFNILAMTAHEINVTTI